MADSTYQDLARTIRKYLPFFILRLISAQSGQETKENNQGGKDTMEKELKKLNNGILVIIIFLFMITMLLLLLAAKATAYPIAVSRYGSNHSLNMDAMYSMPENAFNRVSGINFYCNNAEGYVDLFDRVLGDYTTPAKRINIYYTCKEPEAIKRTLAHELMHHWGYVHLNSTDFSDDQKSEFMQRFNFTFPLEREPRVYQLFTQSETETFIINMEG